MNLRWTVLPPDIWLHARWRSVQWHPNRPKLKCECTLLSRAARFSLRLFAWNRESRSYFPFFVLIAVTFMQPMCWFCTPSCANLHNFVIALHSKYNVLICCYFRNLVVLLAINQLRNAKSHSNLIALESNWQNQKWCLHEMWWWWDANKSTPPNFWIEKSWENFHSVL